VRIVVDTNVLVSGLLSPFGPPAEIVRLVAAGRLTLCLDARILAEYADVLHRPRFDFEPSRIEALLDQIRSAGVLAAVEPLLSPLPDRDDEPFLEAAIAGRAEYLVTGNLRHYPRPRRQRVRVVTPAAFIGRYRQPAPGTLRRRP
jgi:putative PIN family toxin of toxin-antitoxin system